MNVYLDVESNGLKGSLLTVQYSIGRNPVQIIRVSKEPDKMKALEALLDDPTNIFIGFSLKFDFWKLYQYFQRKERFKTNYIDLSLCTLLGKPFCFYNLQGGKAICSLTKIPKEHYDIIREKVFNELSSILPPFIELKTKKKEVKVNGRKVRDLVTMQIFPKCSFKLKNLIRTLYGEKTIKLDEALRTPESLGFEENRSYYITPQEEPLYRQLNMENENILDNPDSVAYEYMRNDIEYLWKLEDYLVKNGNTIPTDFSDVGLDNYLHIVSHAVAFSYYEGIPIDREKLAKVTASLKAELDRIHSLIPCDLQSAKDRNRYINEIAPDNELLREMLRVTNKNKLETIILDDEMIASYPEFVEKLKLLVAYKPLYQRYDMCLKLNTPDGRCHPDFRVAATSTNRMAGTGGFNLQAVARDKDIRSLFLGSGSGDFDSLEQGLGAQYQKDENMLREILNGIDMHTRTVSLMFDEYEKLGYDECMKIKKNHEHPKYYEFKNVRLDAKRINFAIQYFCEAGKIAEILKLKDTPHGMTAIEKAEKLMEEKFFSHYTGLKRSRELFKQKFCTCDFETWAKSSADNMCDRIHNMFGQIRYCSFDRQMAILFWKNCNMFASILTPSQKTKKIVRQSMKGEQTVAMALRSACLGAASSIQKAVSRQLGNNPVQSSGATSCQLLMANVFMLAGCSIYNIHDEIFIPKGYENKFQDIKEVVDSTVEFLRKNIAITLKMDFTPVNTWADKA